MLRIARDGEGAAARAGRRPVWCRRCEPTQAAALSAAFLRDVTENIALASRTLHRSTAASPMRRRVTKAWFRRHAGRRDGSAAGRRIADDAAATCKALADRLLHAAQSLLAAGYAAACLLNSDSPTLPTAFSVTGRARAAIARRAGGARPGGGRWLLPARACKPPHATLFADIAWSTDSVAAATRARASALGLDVVTLPTWYDVDDPASLNRLSMH